MPVKKVLKIGNPFLRKRSRPVDWAADPVEQYLQDLKDTLEHLQQKKRIGRAIAGPQIGYLKRVIYMAAGEQSIRMINPRIIKKSADTFEVWDSCFSADVAFFGKTLRHKAITVAYTNERREEIQTYFSDDLAELFQHEIDHLEGILFTDRIIDNQIIMRSEWERRQKNGG